MNNNNEQQKGPMPLDGEQGVPSVAASQEGSSFLKRVIGVIVLGASIGAIVYGSFFANKVDKTEEKKAEAAGAKAARVEGFAAKHFDKPPEGAPTLPGAQVTAGRQVPGVEPLEADPIGLKGDSPNGPGAASTVAKASPLDSSAVVTLASAPPTTNSPSASGADTDPSVIAARQRLSTLQNAMGGLTDSLKTLSKPSTPSAPGAAPADPPGLVSQMKASAVARISPTLMPNMSLTLPKGTNFNCALKTRIVSELSGFVSCQVLRNVYSMDGRVLLIERGSDMGGEYTARIKNGQTRIFVIWSRVRSVEGVSIDIASPATGALGEAGIDGYVDNHWFERFGGAILVTLIDDAVKVAVAQQNDKATTVITQDTGDTASKVAEKMLDASVNIPPTIYKNQGEVVGIYVSGDVDFSSVYDLRVADR